MTNFGIVDLHSNNIHVEFGGLTIGKIQIPSDFVPYTFAPILGQHQLVTGDELVNGLIVVIEDKMVRDNPERLSPEYPDRSNGYRPTDYDRASLEEDARWALVTDLKFEGHLVKFTAIYSDGTMRNRTYNKSYKWAVLNDFKMLPLCPLCNLVHEPREDQPTPDLDKMTADVTSQLFGETMSFQEFSDRLADDESFLGDIFEKTMEKVFGGFFGQVGPDGYPDSGNPAEIPADRPQRPGETDNEYADRLRDEDEIAGEYDASERAKVKQQIADDEVLADLRRKLRGEGQPLMLRGEANFSVKSDEQ